MVDFVYKFNVQSAKLQSSPPSVFLICLCDKVYHKHEVQSRLSYVTFIGTCKKRSHMTGGLLKQSKEIGDFLILNWCLK